MNSSNSRDHASGNRVPHDLLTTAAERAVDLTGATPRSLEWTTEAVSQRRDSVIRKLALQGGPHDAPVIAYHKSYRSNHRGEAKARKEQQFRIAVERSGRLNARFNGLAADRPIWAAVVLGADPSTLTIITLAVPGEPLGKAWRRALVPRRPGTDVEIFFRVGQAVRTIEQCADLGEGSGTDFLHDKRRLAEKRIAATFKGEECSWLLLRLGQLVNAVVGSDGVGLYAHDDLSATNLIVDRGRLGIIDFSWSTAIRHYDLATFVLRLQCETPRWSRGTEAAIRSTLAGYGGEQVLDEPTYRLARFWRAVAILSEAGAPRTSLRPRVYREVRKAIADEFRDGV